MATTRREEIKEQFIAYHKKNPQVMVLFVQFTEELVAAGRKRGSAHAVMHRIRWHHDLAAGDDDEFKINNNYAAWYSRLFEHRHPEHKGFFKRRRQTSADDPPKGRKVKLSQVNKPDTAPLGIDESEL